jgi:hypothetical protein
MNKKDLHNFIGYADYGMKIKILDKEWGEFENVWARIGIPGETSDEPMTELNPQIHIPFLYPISAIYDEIEYFSFDMNKRIKVIPIVELAKIYNSNSEAGWRYNKIGGYAVSRYYDFFSYNIKGKYFEATMQPSRLKRIDIQCKMFAKMDELQIDYCGLIESGLAHSIYEMDEGRELTSGAE